jgi:hypothetical protein
VLVEDDDRAVDEPTSEDCERGLAEARTLAQKIVAGEGNLARLADGIYWAGWNNGGFASRSGDPVRSDDPVCPELNHVAAQFVQIAYALEHPADKDAMRVIVTATRKAAEAFLEGRPFPEWPDGARIRV